MICCPPRVFVSLSDLQALPAVDLRGKALTSFSLCWFFTLQHLKAFCCRDNSRADTAFPDTRSSGDGIPGVATRFPLLRSDLCQVLPTAATGVCPFWFDSQLLSSEGNRPKICFYLKPLSSVRENYFHVPLDFLLKARGLLRSCCCCVS